MQVDERSGSRSSNGGNHHLVSSSFGGSQKDAEIVSDDELLQGLTPNKDKEKPEE